MSLLDSLSGIPNACEPLPGLVTGGQPTEAELEAFLTTTDGHNLERTLDVAADALRLPDWDALIAGADKLSGNEALALADSITVMYHGRVICEGDRAHVVADPRVKEIYLAG